MSPTGQTGWLRRLRILGIALHLVFVLAAPFEHHDLVCHLKQPLHCTSCASSPVGASPYTINIVGAWTLADAGRAMDVRPVVTGTLLAVRTTGRSPPLGS